MVDSQSIAKSNDGLSKGSVGLVGLIFQAMGQLSPIGIFGGSILGAMSFALGATPLSFVIGLFASLLAGNSVYQYSRKVASARGYYGYVGHGLGGIAGGYVSYMYILYQLANLVFIIAYYVLTFGITVGFVFNTSIPNYYGYIYAILISAPAFYVVYRGIKPSYRSQIVSNSIQLIFVVLISVVVILSVKDNTTMVFTPMAGIGWKGVLLGFIAGSYLSFAGYGSVVPLGEEAKTPHRSIGLAVLIIILVMGGDIPAGFLLNNCGSGIHTNWSIQQFTKQYISRICRSWTLCGTMGKLRFPDPEFLCGLPPFCNHGNCTQQKYICNVKRRADEKYFPDSSFKVQIT